MLKRQAANIAASGGRPRLRKGMVMAQIALSLLLLIAAGLFTRSLGRLLSVDPGFRATNLTTFAVDPRLAGYDVGRTRQFYSELQRQLTLLAGVQGAGMADPGPLTEHNRGGSVTVEGYRAKEGEDLGASFHFVSDAYFSTMGIPVLAGREFTARDVSGAPKVGVVNESFVKRYFGSESPLGRHVATGTGNVSVDIEIVGVVRDNKHGNLRDKTRQTLFLPAAQEENPGGYTFYVRGRTEAADFAQRIRSVVQHIDPEIPVFGFKTMQMEIDESLFTERLVRALSIAFGVLAAALSAIGVYGVLAYTVARRTSEIGIRVALGAKKADVLRLVMQEVALLSLVGVAIGIVGAFVASRWIESELYGVKARDPLVYLAACASLLVVALVAAWIPARRAANISPLTALRYE